MKLLLLLLLVPLISIAHAQFQTGGVDKDGSWYVGEGLKQGDYFSYDMCYVDYKECIEFQMKFWIRGDIQVGTETKWLVDVVVYDGNDIIKGNMELGKIAPEPTGGTKELGVYRGAFKSSIAWLSAFATADGYGGKGPKEFRDISWGKIGNIGGEQVLPKSIESVTVPAGTFDTVQIGWKTGGKSSNIWIVDDFPFPVKADTYTHVSEGIPPQEYKFILLEYQENVQDPFKDIKSTESELNNCDEIIRDNSIKKSTVNYNYQIHVFYGPAEPVKGCEMKWLINFISKYDQTEFLNQVQFDVLVYNNGFDTDVQYDRSIADEKGRPFLYSPSGQYTLDMMVKESGNVDYVIYVRGLAPKNIQPSNPDYLVIPMTVISDSKIPEWIKDNAKYWVDGDIDDSTFLAGIEYLVQQDVIIVPETGTVQNNNGTVPSWIKDNAKYWVDGDITDDMFISAIQYLIMQGIIVV